MKLSEVYLKPPVISVEIFPPKGEGEEFEAKKEKLFRELSVLNEYCKPRLVSITYGAGGKSRANSSVLTREMVENFDYDIILPHFTCVCSDKKYIEDYLREIEGYKIENILALRGDEPEDITVCYRDFKYASDLVEFVKKNTSFQVAVAGYPEGHKLSGGIEDDVKYLKNKVDKGAEVIFTQFFFENEKFYKYVETIRKKGVNVPVAAGILPVISYEGLLRMADLAGIKLSNKVKNHFEKWAGSKEDTVKAGIEWANRQTEDLLKNKVDGIHFYMLNKAHSAVEILKYSV